MCCVTYLKKVHLCSKTRYKIDCRQASKSQTSFSIEMNNGKIECCGLETWNALAGFYERLINDSTHVII